MFAFLVSASLRSRLIVLFAAVIVAGYGLFAQRELSVDVFPDLNKGIVTVVTAAPGLAPEEVEVLITTPIEAAMGGAAGMTRVRTSSSTGLSIVYVEFDWGVDVYRARQLVTERLMLAEEKLPEDTAPLLMPVSSYMGEILLVAMTGENADPMVMRELADWVIAPRLQAIPGVSRVVPIGGLVRQYRVTPNLLRLNDLGVTLQTLEEALTRFGTNSGGGVVDQSSQEFLIRNVGRSRNLEDLRDLTVTILDGHPILLRHVAAVEFQPQQRRGDAGFNGRSAVILSIQKQPAADTLILTRKLEEALTALSASLPDGIRADHVVFRQADFIEASVDTMQLVMIEAVVAVSVVLFLFMANARATAISLVAIPLSVLTTFIVFRLSGLTLNTMTLGGLAIAVGELVDDAVVDVENISRRLSENRRRPTPLPTLRVIADASQEIRSGIVYSTIIIILVFLPVFAVPGLEGRLFAPLGIAYIVSILASLIISITVTPVLCSLLLPGMKRLNHGDTRFIRTLKRVNTAVLERVFRNPRPLLIGAGAAVFLAVAVVPTLPRSFLPPFNEKSLLVELTLEPGISLEESARIGAMAERLLLQIPEVTSIGRRTGRSESDEHNLGVHVNEYEVRVTLADRRMETVMREVRNRLSGLPGTTNVGQPMSHRLIDHILTGAPAEIVIKVFGDELDVLRTIAQDIKRQLSAVPGLVDLNVEKLVPVPQIQIRVDPRKAQLYGLHPGELTRRLAHMTNGNTVSQIVDGVRYFDVVIRLSDRDRGSRALASTLIETASGPVPLGLLATIEETAGPNDIKRENGRRRILVMANGDGAHNNQIAAQVRDIVSQVRVPAGYYVTFEGIYAEQTRSALRLLGLSLISLLLIFAVLYQRYRSVRLSLIIMTNVPLALVGSLLAIKITGLELSVASMVGFITLTGISTRNGILKISHYINLVLHEGETFGRRMIVRGSNERLMPVLMTAASACGGLVPLLLDPFTPGKEMLFPVAVVIFGGLISSTILDAVLTPWLFLRYGREPLKALVDQAGSGRRAAEAF
ncbi:multidrug transporter AcrB [Thalassobaculum fulvum]|uniref:Multidrug transporter AcrB n=1 Tax=Thalassobaculum fulvum TaxID=1633335 RepID=A0A918XXA4_9PROT|nr:efflux RND transporter permease subunit [Thalassobaculum fulvum]GHD62198.1 multidrug transporter AcrB [Thalassobaculum fulvum]